MLSGYGLHVAQWTTALTASVHYAFWAVYRPVDYCFNDVCKLCFLGRSYGSHVAQWTTALSTSARYVSGYGSHVAQWNIALLPSVHVFYVTVKLAML